MRDSGPVLLVFLVGLAAGTWWLARRGADERVAAPAEAAASPGYYLKQAVLEQTDDGGRLSLRVRAEAASQQDAGGVVRLERIAVDYFPDAGQDWLMTSNAGTLPPAGRVVQLDGDVRLRAAAAAAATGALVRTEHLTLDVGSSLATTADPVHIEFGPHTLAARGLRADLKRETLRLESSVNGTFTR